MSDEDKTAKGRGPSHLVYNIRQYKVGDETRSEWTKIGVAWAHKEGNGFNVKLHAVPVDGELTIYPMTDRKSGPAEEPAA